jgi:hypothetical protein
VLDSVRFSGFCALNLAALALELVDLGLTPRPNAQRKALERQSLESLPYSCWLSSLCGSKTAISASFDILKGKKELGKNK